jgi:hypothetical protein
MINKKTLTNLQRALLSMPRCPSLPTIPVRRLAVGPPWRTALPSLGRVGQQVQEPAAGQPSYDLLSDVMNRGERKQKVVVLMELHRAIIYTTKMSKRVTKK